MLHPPDHLCQRVLELAREAYGAGEVPVGALVYDGRGSIISEGRNRILECKDATAHAELIAMREACNWQQSERLTGLNLLSSLEPCLMCSGLILHARISNVAFLTYSDRWPGLQHLLATLPDLNHQPAWRLIEDFESDAKALLQSFFAQKR
jgi:tRNA(adenine34) deaminase